MLKEETNSMQQNDNHSQNAISHLRVQGIFLFLPRRDSFENMPPQVEQILQLIREVHHSSVHIWLLHFSVILLPMKKGGVLFLELGIY